MVARGDLGAQVCRCALCGLARSVCAATTRLPPLPKPTTKPTPKPTPKPTTKPTKHLQIPLEEVPSVQKYAVMRARQLGKPAIVAHQLLNSMIQHPVPTRAEVSLDRRRPGCACGRGGGGLRKQDCVCRRVCVCRQPGS
jgi:hypothetical protein